MLFSQFEYLDAQSIDEACSALSDAGEEGKALAGGTVLIPLMKQRLLAPKCLVNLKNLQELKFVRYDEQCCLRIGALTTHRALELSSVVRERLPILAAVEGDLANVRVRNTGTIGGSLCFAEPQSDLPPLLISLGGVATARNSRGSRVFPLEELVLGYYETSLKRDEILVEVAVPSLPVGLGVAHERIRVGSQAAKPSVVVCAAIRLEQEGPHVMHARLTVGGVGGNFGRLRRAEEMLVGEALSDALVADVGRVISESIEPMADAYGSAAYKRYVAGVLTRRAVFTAGARSRQEWSWNRQ